MLTALVMLWLGITGIAMQCIDLHAVLTHQPATTPTGLSIMEGMYGPPDFAVIQSSDFAATALPAGFDIQQGLHTVLEAAHMLPVSDKEATSYSRADGTVAPDAGPASLSGFPTEASVAASNDRSASSMGQPAPMAWVELRLVNGAPVGQVMLGSRLEAFDARTGAPVTPTAIILLPQGRRLPPSLRQRLKTLHRFWDSRDAPGVYFEFFVGLVLWFLMITGLVIYFQVLKTRFRQGRKSLLWFSGGWWRGTHRAVSIISAAVLLCIGFSGTWIGFESSVGSLRKVLTPTHALTAATGPEQPHLLRKRNPVDFIIPLRGQEVEQMTRVTLDAMRRLHPFTPVKVIRLRIYGQSKQGVVVTSNGDQTNQLVFDADSGEPATLSEMGYPQSNFPFGTQVHENMKHFHSGAMFGISGRLMNLFAGFSLTFLATSGLWMYVDMWQKRRRANRGNFMWR